MRIRSEVKYVTTKRQPRIQKFYRIPRALTLESPNGKFRGREVNASALYQEVSNRLILNGFRHHASLKRAVG